MLPFSFISISLFIKAFWNNIFHRVEIVSHSLADTSLGGSCSWNIALRWLNQQIKYFKTFHKILAQAQQQLHCFWWGWHSEGQVWELLQAEGSCHVESVCFIFHSAIRSMKCGLFNTISASQFVLVLNLETLMKQFSFSFGENSHYKHS